MPINEENEHKLRAQKLQFTATLSMVVIYNLLHEGASK
jgi:hypothetical protein